MFSHTMSAAAVGCTLLLAPMASIAADRGPSTPVERKQALDYIHQFEANPLGPHAIQEREWILRWIIQIPDIHLNMCVILDQLPQGDKKDANTIYVAETFAQTAFLIQNPERQSDILAQYQAGVEGALRVYEILLKGHPKDREPYLDDLIQRRKAGTLAQFVKERAASSCRN